MLTEVNYEKLPSYLLGFEIGEERGVEKGRVEGIERGEKQKAIEIAKNLLDILDSETIAMKTGLTIKDVEKLKIDMSKK